jgi:hypothetical protein
MPVAGFGLSAMFILAIGAWALVAAAVLLALVLLRSFLPPHDATDPDTPPRAAGNHTL